VPKSGTPLHGTPFHGSPIIHDTLCPCSHPATPAGVDTHEVALVRGSLLPFCGDYGKRSCG
jgi:hypothetical protein